MKFGVSARRLAACSLLASLLTGLFGCADERDAAGDFLGPLNTAEPHLAKAGDGTVILSFIESNGLGAALNWVSLPPGIPPDSENWSAPHTIVSAPNQLVNWADFPAVTPLSNSLWAAHWMLLSPSGDFNYSAWYSLSRDEGKTWGTSRRLHDDDSATEHGFVSFYPQDDGAGAVWLDGRNFAAPSAPHAGHAHNGPLGTQLRTAKISHSGVRVSDTAVDSFICDCCQTDAARSGDAVVVAYRGRTENNIRDIHTARLVNDHWTLNGPVAEDGWRVTGCPVNGPAIDATDSVIALTWYTEHPAPAVRIAFSQDAGATFGAAIDLALDQPIGRVDVVQLAASDAVASWIQKGSGTLLVRRVTIAGALSDPVEIAQLGASRQAGFPQMLEREGKLLFAFTDQIQNSAAVALQEAAAALQEDVPASLSSSSSPKPPPLSTTRVRTLIHDIPQL